MAGDKSAKGRRLLKCRRSLSWNRGNTLRLGLDWNRLRWLGSWRCTLLTWGRLLWSLEFLRLGREQRLFLKLLGLDLRVLVEVDTPTCQRNLTCDYPNWSCMAPIG